MSDLAKARALALAIPAALLGGAYVSQYWGGLHPCEMCWWQRYAHMAAIALAVLAFAAARTGLGKALILSAAVAILVSGGIGVFHAGVEYHWWEGLTTCSTGGAGGSAGDVLAEILATPLIRCDQAQWTLFGLSLAGYNAIFSIAGGVAVLWQALKR
jgi:disulfide bond formation protein DsbB